MYKQIFETYGIGPALYHYYLCKAFGMTAEQAFKWCVAKAGTWE